jgi:polysaccharide biosynthesis protein PelE
MTVAKLLIYGLLGEQSAILSLFSLYPVWAQLLLFLAGHAIASVMFSLLLTGALPRRYEVSRWGGLALFFSFTFFIPVFGAVGMLAALIYFRFFQRHVNRTEFSSAPLPPFMHEAGGPSPGMGEGGAWSRLRTVELPRASRLKALLAVGSGSGLNASQLLQLATSDNDDEIRLLAFNLYDRREKVIGAAISDTLKALRATDVPAEQASLCRKLAFAYWEILYNGMAKNELADFFADQAISYADRVLRQRGDDASLLVLMGRIYLWKDELEKAETFIHAALEQGAHRDRVVPYLAEFAFRRRDFASLRSYFRSDPLLRYKPGIGPIASFWMG